MDEPARLSREERVRILEASGVRALTNESSYGEILRALVFCRRLVMYAYPHDIALVYASVVDHFDTVKANLPMSTESLFFDTFYADMTDGKIREEERSRLRAQDRSVDEGSRGDGGEERDRDAAGEHGGRDRRIEIMVPERKRDRPGAEGGGASEVPEEPERVGGSKRGGRSDGLPF